MNSLLTRCRSLLGLAAAWTLGGSAVAQDPAELALPADTFRFRGHVIDDTRGDGWVTARGETYKLEATGAEFTVVGLFGPDAPSMPVRFALRSARLGEADANLGDPASLLRRGDGHEHSRLELNHGDVLERWRVMDRSLEQSFVFGRSVVGTGASLVIEVDTLLPILVDGDGVAFPAGDHGTIRYRDFAVTDAIGQRRSLPIRLDGRRIILAASAKQLAGMVEPIVFDPTITFVGIRLGTTRARFPDVAVDPLHRRIAVCYEEVISATDTDVMFAHLNSQGGVVTQFALDNRSVRTVRPRIASSLHGQMFAAVWRQAAGAGIDRIESRRISTIDMTVQSLQTLAQAPSGRFATDPDIGGSVSTVDTAFLFGFGTFEDGVFPRNSEVIVGGLSRDGVRTGLRTLDSDTGCTSQPQVAVSRHGGSFGQFGVVYTHGRGCLSNQTDIAFAVVNSTTTPVFGPTLVATNSGADQRPDVAAIDNRWFVVFERLTGSNNDLIGAAFRFGNGVFTRTFGPVVMSALEPGVNLALAQVNPSIDFDGCRFSYAYREGTSAPRVRTATFALASDAGSIQFSAGNEPIDGNTADAFDTPRLAFGGEEVSRAFVAWTGGTNNTDEDVVGALIDVAADGFPPFTTLRTGCGTRGIPSKRVLLGGDLAVIGRPMTLVVDPAAGSNAILIGLVAPSPLPLCGGGVAPCLLGVDPILSAIQGNGTRVAVPCDPNLVGAPIAVQVVDFFVGGGCGAAVFGVPLTVSDTLVVRLL
ncbi:MAG: hypothetical protein AB7I19_00840 [Planctomycetota bacterium]